MFWATKKRHEWSHNCTEAKQIVDYIKTSVSELATVYLRDVHVET